MVTNFVPTENDGEDDRWRIQNKTHGEASGYEKDKTGQAARFGVEAPFEIFVGRKDVGPIEKGDECHAQDDHDERLRQIDLNERHPGIVGLPGGPDIRNGAGLSGHDGKPDRPPAQRALAAEIIIQVFVFSAVAEAFRQDIGKVEDNDNPVGNMHGR